MRTFNLISVAYCAIAALTYLPSHQTLAAVCAAMALANAGLYALNRRLDRRNP